MSLRPYHRPSPNFNDRQHGEKPWAIVLHSLGGKHFNFAMKRLFNIELELSAHYIIHQDGTVLQLVDDKHRAWHAGRSSWYGRTDMNSASIGIELDHRYLTSTKDTPYSHALLTSLTKLCRTLMKRHDIHPAHVLAHGDISPDRKEDPGHLFPWDRLAAEGIATLPQPTLQDAFTVAAALEAPQGIDLLLKDAGYAVDGFGKGTPKPTQSQLITAFQRHYQQEAFQGNGQVGVADATTLARLAALAHQNKPLHAAHKTSYQQLVLG